MTGWLCLLLQLLTEALWSQAQLVTGDCGDVYAQVRSPANSSGFTVSRIPPTALLTAASVSTGRAGAARASTRL